MSLKYFVAYLKLSTGMLRFFQLCFLFVISANSFSQNLAEKMTAILGQIGNNIPADQIFLHLDRNLYHGGDTIRFQAYIRDSQTGVFETPSKSLYVLLLNHAHVTIDSARFRISYSTASGWLKVPEIIPVGYFSILAYTSDQMNYDPVFAFNTPVRIDKINPARSNTEPEESKVKAAADLRFLPEGGTYIYGVRQRLAFNAISSDGRNIKVSGNIVNQNGKKITEISSGPYGPGVVEFTPIKGETYYAKPVEAEFGKISWPLPEPEKSGVSMRVDNVKSGSFDIMLRGNETNGKEYFLTVTMNNILIFSRELKLDTLFTARIETAEIPSGTAFVTLYDNELNPVAERLIFLNSDRKMKVQIGVSKPNTRTGSETELTINTTDEKGNNISSIISVSAIDSSLGFYNGIPCTDIESVFLYDDEFYNNLPQSIKCTGLKNIDNKSIDLLMMTYGWRKYTLKESALAYQEKRPDNYDHLKISNPGKEKKGRQEIDLLSPEGGEVIILRLNENRETVLPFDSLDVYARQIMVLPDDDPSRNSNPVSIEFPENKEYTDKAKLIITDSSYSETEFASIDNELPVFNPDSAIMIEPVTIKGHKKKSTEYDDKKAQQFKYTGAFTLYGKDFEFAQTFEDILYKLSPTKIFLKTKMVLLRSRNGGASGTPALFVVDDVPIFDRSYWPIAQMPVEQIASVTVLKGYEGFSRYGALAYGGVIFVTTKAGNRINGVIDPNEESGPGNDLLKYIRLFRSEVEFYIPTKKEVELIPEFKFRPTILWKDNVYIDGSGPVKFKYPNNLGNGTVMIFVNGVSFTNLIGSNRSGYTIK
jgi:hypothetical protein